MFREKKRRVKLPLRAYLLYFTLLSFLLTGVTFSKYVTRSTGGDSARVVQFGDLTISENGNNWAVVPGMPIKKQAVVMTTSVSEVSAFVFITINAPSWVFDKGNNTYSRYITNNDVTMTALSWSAYTGANAWNYLQDDSGKQVYYILLQPGEALSMNIFSADNDGNTISVNKDLIKSQLTNDFTNSLKIYFKAYLVQAGGFATAKDAWDSIPH